MRRNHYKTTLSSSGKPTSFFFCTQQPEQVSILSLPGNIVATREASVRTLDVYPWIFCGDDEQFEIAKRVKGQLQIAIDQKVVKVFQDRWVVTKICELKEFTVAQAAHQEYLFKNPNGYCTLSSVEIPACVVKKLRHWS